MVYSNCLYSSAFCWSLTFVILLRIAWWPFVAKELFSKLSALRLFYFMSSKLCVFLSHLLSGQDVELYSIGS